MRPSSRLATLVWALAACQPGPEAAEIPFPCDTAPDEGAVVARNVLCAEDAPAGGEGRIGDQWLASAWLRVVVRSAQGSVSQAGVDGGTLVDVAPWGYRDRMHEVFALVGGGWLDVDSARVEGDAIRVAGSVRSLPGLEPVDEGASAEVVWRLDPDGPWITAEGAEGFVLHPRGSATLEEGRLAVDGVTHAAEGAWTDLGGAVRVDGTDRLLVAPAAEALALLEPAGRSVVIEAPDAEHVDVLDGDTVLATLPAGGGAVRTRLPAAADGLRARAEGREASPVEAISAEVLLEVGDAASLEVVPAWTGRPHAFAVTWTGSAGTGRTILPANGGLVPTGPGPASLAIDEDRSWTGEVGEGDAWLPILEGDDSPRVRATLCWPSDRSWTWRGTDAAAVLEASAAGWDHVVLVADRDVPAGPGSQAPGASSTTGTTTTAGGHPLVAWRVSDNARRAGHGSPDVAGLPVLDAIAVLSQGGRSTLAPAAALVGPEPWALDPAPTHVLLDDPADAPLATWAPWLALVDSGLSVWPAGPGVRVHVPEPATPSALDIEAGLARGHLAATTGPDLWLTVDDDVIPGDLRPSDGEAPVVIPTLASPGSVDRVALIVDGALQGPYLPDTLPEVIPLTEEARWVVLAGWTSTGGDWAVTAPIWLRPAAP